MSELSDFEPLEEIGRGRRSIVYRGHQLSVGRPVAIRCLDENSSKDARKLDRFIGQAQFSGQFNHPHLVQIISVVKEKGWVVMELMQGSLEACVGKKQLKPSDARIVLAQVLDALEYIHGQGNIHGLIRPSNILFDAKKGVAKLSDFQEINFDAGISSSEAKSKYLAPELLNTEHFGEVSRQLDLYNLGFTILEAMSGDDFSQRVANIGPGAGKEAGWMRWHSSPEPYPPAIELIPNLPADIANLLDAVLKKPVQDRLTSANEASDILDHKVGSGTTETLEVISELKMVQPKSSTQLIDEIPGPPNASAPSTLTSRKMPVNSSKGSSKVRSRANKNESRRRFDLNNKRVFYPVAAIVFGLAAAVGLFLVGDDKPERTKVIITTGLQGVEFRVGEQTVPAKKTRKTGDYALNLRPSTYELTASREGFDSVTKTIEVTSRSQEFDFELPRSIAVVAITVTPADAKLSINGSPLSKKENGYVIEHGVHKLAIAADGYHTDTKEITVTKDTEPIELELKRIRCKVVFSLNPKDSLVQWGEVSKQAEDGEVTLEMAAGKHLVSIQREGCQSIQRNIEVTSGGENRVEENLKLVVTSKVTPSDSELLVEGLPIDEDPDSPGTYYLFPGEHEVEISKAGYQTHVAIVTIGLSEPNVIAAALQEMEISKEGTKPPEDKETTFSQLTAADQAKYLWMYARAGIRSPQNAEFAEQQLTKAIDLNPELRQAYRDRAISRITLRKTELAKRDFQQAVELLPSKASTSVEQKQSAADKSPPTKQKANAYEKIGFDLLQEYSKLLASTGELKASLAQSEAALQRRKHATGPRVLRAEIFFREGRTELAKSEVDALLLNSSDTQQISYALNLQGLILQREGKQAEAHESFKAAVKNNDANAEAHTNVGKSARELAMIASGPQRNELLDLANSAYRNAAKIKPQLEESLLPLAAQIQADKGELQASIQIYSELIKKYGATPERYRNRSALYKQVGNTIEAAKDMTRYEDLRNRN